MSTEAERTNTTRPVKINIQAEQECFLQALRVKRGHRGVKSVIEELLDEKVKELIKESGFIPPH